eukprot:1472053-Rhodomonas_salina.1
MASLCEAWNLRRVQDEKEVERARAEAAKKEAEVASYAPAMRCPAMPIMLRTRYVMSGTETGGAATRKRRSASEKRSLAPSPYARATLCPVLT